MSFLGNAALPQVTASAWFKTSHTGPPTGSVQQNNWAILDFDRSEYFDLYVRDTDGAIGFSTNHGGPGANVHDMVGNTTGLNDGAWHHVVAVYDGTHKHIYVDGAPDGSTVAPPPHGGNPLGSTAPRFGLMGDGSEATSFNTGPTNDGRNQLYYDGRIDDVALWNTALSAADAAALAAGTESPDSGLAPLPTLAPGPQTIDFESLAGVPEGSLVSNRVSGMTFDGAMIVLPPDPRFGFTSAAGDDVPLAGEPAGGVMISDIGDINSSTDPVGPSPFNPIVVNWNGLAVEDLTFRVVDIDGNHEFRGSVYDAVEGGALLGNLVIDAGDSGTGDGIATLIDFSALTGIRRLEFEVENVGAGNSGFAADNFSFTAIPDIIPEPATLVVWSLLAGLGIGVGWRRRR